MWNVYLVPVSLWVLSRELSPDKGHDDSKQAIGMNMSINGFLSLCTDPALDWQPSLLPNDSLDRLSDLNYSGCNQK